MKKSFSAIKPILVVGACLTLASCQLGRMVIYNFADIRDYKNSPPGLW